MKFSVSRDALLKPLQLVAGVVERRQTLPVLSNVLVALEGDRLSLTGTDLEVELIGRVQLEKPGTSGEITVPARKFLDICKSLPDGANIDFSFENQRVIVKSGKSRFTLSTLPATDFPSVEDGPSSMDFVLKQEQLKRLIERTAFAMAQQDVRYYLNGMLFELKPEYLRTVATDGHRLAMCTLDVSTSGTAVRQAILPRKGVLEIVRLMNSEGALVRLVLGTNHIRAITDDFTFTSKLVDGKFPDYERVLPKGGNKTVEGNRNELRQALNRVSILSNEKYRGVRMHLVSGVMTYSANNPEQEEAEEQVTVNYTGDALEMGFNVNYLVDVLSVLSGENIKIILSDANSSALLQEANQDDSVYVVMPMRL